MITFMSLEAKGIKAGEPSATQGSLLSSFEGYELFIFF